ncbi:unnamed protein product [Rotaria magnacalcarata]|uniref:Uncharacterized protein n=3 Tax=Rotaria TaxID=231623 RepID=A0A816ZGN5_9BILA|nr:unnamed protein product [Rotaria magnacalcarata]CAF3475696.1 unnamed protein product [Rotaria socialis]CAF1594936.1 unnamed protein product [Rotaria magnacalcarata]CAF2204397.1 unnamed protein product [Rotaria magnacalcarata]CAF4205586.1 unnamed protein product [Rotaria magnacalcarata]
MRLMINFKTFLLILCSTYLFCVGADENLRIRQFRHKCIDHFRKNARAANAVEVEGLLAENLFSYCSSISKQLATKLSKNERELNADDREMCNVTSAIHADDEEEDDEEL